MWLSIPVHSVPQVTVADEGISGSLQLALEFNSVGGLEIISPRDFSCRVMSWWELGDWGRVRRGVEALGKKILSLCRGRTATGWPGDWGFTAAVAVGKREQLWSEVLPRIALNSQWKTSPHFQQRK